MKSPLASQSSMDILSLPTELLQHIATYLSNSHLKSLRLTCRQIEKAASTVLFSTFVLHPHDTSLEKLRGFARSPVRVSHLRHLIYDCTCQNLLQILDLRLASDRRTVASRDALCHNVDHGRQSDQINFLLTLQTLFPLLTNTTKITILGAHLSVLKPQRLPSFYAELLGPELSREAQDLLDDLPFHGKATSIDNRRDYDIEGAVLAVLTAVPGLPKPLTSFEVIGNSSKSWLNKQSLLRYPVHYQSIWTNLQDLNLSCQHLWSLHRNALECLQLILVPAANLTSLTIGLRELGQSSAIIESPSGWFYDRANPSKFDELYDADCLKSEWLRLDENQNLIANLGWSRKLESLEFRGLSCSAEELKAILKFCANSLSSLKFVDLILKPMDNKIDGPRACLVGMIKWIRENLRLKSVAFSGHMTNCGMQHWVIKETSSYRPRSLHQSVVNYVLNRGACPLETVQIQPGYFDLGKKYKIDPPPQLSTFLENQHADIDWTFLVPTEAPFGL